MFIIDYSYYGGLEGLDVKVKQAIAMKLGELTMMLHDKVVENVSGKILQKQSGKLAASIQKTLDIEGNPMIGSVFPEPQDAKAFALEKGGEKSYTIVPNKASALNFFWHKIGQEVFLKRVNHPSSKEFAYLRRAAEEMEPIVPSAFKEVLEQLL